MKQDRVDLKEAVALVTGASSGIGWAIAETFAAQGSRIVATARRADRLEALATKIGQDRVLAVPGDVTDYAQIEGVVCQAIERFGRVDVMVNNAGYAVDKPLVESTPEEIAGQIDVNLTALAYGCRAVVGHMMERRSGSILNIGSICSYRHYPNYASYVAAKFGVLGFSRSLYEEVREYGIRVNCLCPAAVNTEWADVAGAELPWPKDQRLQPEDLAELAVLCVRMPRRVQIEDIVLWPVCEPTT